ncbi:hypothetical protein [Actinoplanes flavus]|uniref:Uncharacterized protein n=1 Tax=Actinoplanes flavus TaxID=2820290 RepID=A0ABS3UTN2_9ACTN|nr:hypothetical protein [Actinoplanes flavus]MBO3741930.1 hypothetical protein [Actinoplanes flavus]
MLKAAISRATVVCGVAMTMIASGPVTAAHAAYYNTYTDIASTPDLDCCKAAQGFAAGATYLYSIKNDNDSDAVSAIYRVNKATGERVVMRNGTDDRSTNTWLGHGNDMTIVDIDGVHHMFIVTMDKTTAGVQLVKLRYDGTTYEYAGAYRLRLNGGVLPASGVNRVSVTGTTITFMFKSGRTVYNGSLPLRADSGNIDLTKAFDLQVDGALVDGATVPDLGTFTAQGFFYDQTEHVLYNPLTKDKRSIVLVYRNVTPATTGTAPAATDLSFRITSAKYSQLFEIEGVGISDGKLYFNTNRRDADGAGHDGVHVFDGYTVP